jgi:hypothetical protein
MPCAYGQLLIATVLMICIAYAWAKRDHSTDPAENHNGRICPPVTCNMQWLLVFLDALYLMFAGAFTRKFGQYPSARYATTFETHICRNSQQLHLCCESKVYSCELFLRDVLYAKPLFCCAACIHIQTQPCSHAADVSTRAA